MTINKAFAKLRAYGSGNIRQFLFCVFFAVMLMTSLAVIMFSPMVERSMGLSSMTLLIFCVAFIGCAAFVMYGAGLFLRFKSREFGIFLALGMPKKKLSKALFREIRGIFVKAAAGGLVSGAIIAYVVWILFSRFIITNDNAAYQFSVIGYLIGIGFSGLVLVLVLFQARRFTKKMNIMDTMNAGRMNEAVARVSKNGGTTGMVLLFAGIFLGYGVPIFVGHELGIILPSAWSITYLLSLIGIYRIMLYAVSYQKRGKNPQKYYQNLIVYGTMKFQGRQTVRNMFVIALLIVAGLYASFYTPSQMSSITARVSEAEPDFVFAYDQGAEEITEEEIIEMAARNDLEIRDFRTGTYLELPGSGYDRDVNDKGVITEEYIESYRYYQFISSSDYERLTGNDLHIGVGTYYLITHPEYEDGTWYKKNDLGELITPEGGRINLQFAGTTEYSSVMGNGINRIVISDSDYSKAEEGITGEYQITQAAFDVDEPDNSFAFAEELYKQYVDGASDKMAVGTTYDPLQQERKKESADEVWNGRIELDADDSTLSGDWKYYPHFRILKQSSDMEYYAVHFLLFLYVSFICMAAIGVISYTRSISVSLQNKKMFEDLRKLGANNLFLEINMKKQLHKIFVLPALIGTLLAAAFEIATSYGNDGRITTAERNSLLMCAGVILVFWIYQYIIYRTALAKSLKIAVYQ